MTEFAARFLVVLALKSLWFLGQVAIFFLLLNFAVTPYFGLADVGPVQCSALYALLRLIIDPPKLRLEFE